MKKRQAGALRHPHRLAFVPGVMCSMMAGLDTSAMEAAMEAKEEVLMARQQQVRWSHDGEVEVVRGGAAVAGASIVERAQAAQGGDGL